MIRRRLEHNKQHRRLEPTTNERTNKTNRTNKKIAVQNTANIVHCQLLIDNHYLISIIVPCLLWITPFQSSNEQNHWYRPGGHTASPWILFPKSVPSHAPIPHDEQLAVGSYTSVLNTSAPQRSNIVSEKLLRVMPLPQILKQSFIWSPFGVNDVGA